MTAVVFPQRAVVVYVKALFDIAGEATRDALTLNRDAATLTRQAFKLVDGGRHGRVMGVLRKYVTETNQFGADKVKEIIAEMEHFVDPKIAQQNKDIKYRREVREEKQREKEAEENKASWEPGGHNFNHAVGELRTDAQNLICMAKVIEDSGIGCAADAMSDWIFSKERERLFAGLKEALKPPPEAQPAPSKRRRRTRPHVHDGNVIDGPWAS